MKANMLTMQSAWSLDLPEVATFPGQPQRAPAGPLVVGAAIADERAAELDRLWRRCSMESATSIVEVRPDDAPYVSGYLARRSFDRLQVEPKPFETEKELRLSLGSPTGPVVVAVTSSYPSDRIGAILSGGRRGQVLVLQAKRQGGPSRSAQAVQRAIEGDAPWVPDRLVMEEAARCLLQAVFDDATDEERSDVEREQARQLAQLVHGRSAGLIPLGRWLRRHRDFDRAIAKLDAKLRQRFLTTVAERGAPDAPDDLVGLCAVILLVAESPERSDGEPRRPATRALVDLAMSCDGRQIPLELAELLLEIDRSAQVETVRDAVNRFVRLGLATIDHEDTVSASPRSPMVSVAAAHQAALRLMNAPMLEQSNGRVVDALHRALDRAAGTNGGSPADPNELLTIVRHCLAVCDTAVDAKVTSLRAAHLMERALLTFGSVPWARMGADDDATSAEELTDWGLALSQRFLGEVQTASGRLSHEAAVAAKTVAWTRRNHGDRTGALAVLEEAAQAVGVVPHPAHLELDAEVRYLRGTILYSDNQVERAREVFESLERQVYPDGISRASLVSVDGALSLGDRVQLGSYLGRIQMAAGELQSARDRLEDLLYTIEDIAEVQDVERWRVMQNLGLALVLLGEVVPADAMLREVLAGREGLLGTEHPDTLQTRTTIARLQLMSGRPLEAMHEASEVAVVRGRVLGPFAPATMSAQLLRTRARLAAGIPDTAAARDLAATRESIVGLDHPSTQLAYRVVAESLLIENRPDEALLVVEMIEQETAASQERARRSRVGNHVPDTRTFELDPFEVIEREHLRLRANAEASGTMSVRPWEQAADGLAALARELEPKVGALHPATLQLRVSAAWALAGAERWTDARSAIDRLLRDLPENMRRHPIAIQANELRIMVAVQEGEPRRARRLVEALRNDLAESAMMQQPATGLASDLLGLEIVVAEAEGGPVPPGGLSAAMDALSATIEARHQTGDAAACSPGDSLRAQALVRRWNDLDPIPDSTPDSLERLTRAADLVPPDVTRRINAVIRGTDRRPGNSRAVSLGSRSAIQLGVQLLVDDHDLAVRRLADAADLNPGWVSTLLRAFEDYELLRRPSKSRPGFVSHQLLFAHLASVWALEPVPGQPGGPAVGVALALPDWKIDLVSGLPTETWAISGDRAAALLGAPMSLTEAAPFDVRIGALRDGPVPGKGPKRSPEDQILLAQKRFGAAEPSTAGTVLQVPPIQVPIYAGLALPEVPDIPVAHPIVIALDLWSSGGRGREILHDWDGTVDGVSWRCW